MSPSSIIVLALLCCSLYATSSSATTEKANFTRKLDTTLSNPMTIRIKSHLFTVSKTKKQLSINSTDPSQKPCQLSVNPFDENIEGRIHVIGIDVSQKILVWGVQSSEIDASTRRIYYTLLFVDPYQCNYQPLRLAEESMPDTWPLLSPSIVLYDKNYDPHFDVYFPTQKQCDPCIYNARDAGGKWVYNTLGSHPIGIPSKEFFMQWYRSGDYNYNFYVYNLNDGSAILKLLNANLGVAKEVQVNHSIDAASVNYGTYQNTAICYATPSQPGPNDHQTVTCERLNERLRPALSWQLPTSKDRLVSAITLEVDQLGNTLIGVMYSKEIRFYVYNVDGDLVGDFDFGSVDQTLAYRELHGIRIDNEYCLATVEQPNAQATGEVRHVVKCIDVSKFHLDKSQ